MLYFPTRLTGFFTRLILFIFVSTATRLTLYLVNFELITNPVVQFIKSFSVGFAFDLVVGLILLFPHLLWVILTNETPETSKWRHRWQKALNFLFIFALLYGAVVEYFFFDEFNARFNYVAVDYLLFPHEVFVNIWDSYPVAQAVALVLIVSYVLHRLTMPFVRQASGAALSRQVRLISMAVYFVLLTILLNFINITTAQVSPNRVVNELALNGYFSFAHAFFSNDLDYNHYYKTLAIKQAHERVIQQLLLPGEKPAPEVSPVARIVTATGEANHMNVVIILEESLGAEFSQLLNSKQTNDLTPALDKLANQSLLFSNVLAAGNRTVRGLEATLTSFAPIPGQSIVKRNDNENVFSLARILKENGYSTRFIYGGFGYFDNMGEFAKKNSFDTVVDQADFADSEKTFTTIWGVCDEDLFNRSLKELDNLSSQKRPFFSTILTVSNHKPYTYPEGRIPEDPKQQKRRNAVKYADFALGQFFEKAKDHAWYDNTLFVVLGDHGARVYGEQEIPIDSYRIPLVFFAPKLLSPEVDSRLGSQLDVAPTILGMLNISYTSAFFGRDLRRIHDGSRFALVSHNRDVGLLRDGQMIVLGLQRNANLWTVDIESGSLAPLRHSEEDPLMLDAISIYQTAYTEFKSGNWKPHHVNQVESTPTLHVGASQ